MCKNSFDKGPEGWCSYDYHASVVAGRHNLFILATWEKQGGVHDSPYIWVDHTRWSADTPEKPLSILPLIFYRNWMNKDPIDLREAAMSVFLRGDDLCFDGAQCLFWVYGRGGRWHLNSRPLTLSSGEWSSQPLRFSLPNEETAWHHSWPPEPGRLVDTLGAVESYGFSFVGFGPEVSGRLSMDEFEIKPRGNKALS
jgi:hypothetical protein